MRIVVSGIKGAGKTTVVNYILKKRPDIRVIVVGDYFAKVFNKMGFKRDEGDLGIRRSDYVKIQKEVFKKVRKDIKKEKNVIVDTNMFFQKVDGYYPGLPAFVLKDIDIDSIVLVEYSPEEILKRRKKDERELGRVRSAAMDIRRIDEEQKIQEYYAFVCSGLFGCAVKIIRKLGRQKYPFEHSEQIAEEILKLFQ